MANELWYFARGSEQHGPVAIDQLRQMIASGRVLRTDLVWTEGMAAWEPAASRAEFAQAEANQGDVYDFAPPPADAVPVPVQAQTTIHSPYPGAVPAGAAPGTLGYGTHL